jgi:hypothetical protein
MHPALMPLRVIITFIFLKHFHRIIRAYCKSVQRLKSAISWDITLCSPLKFYLRFGGIYRLDLQG